MNKVLDLEEHNLTLKFGHISTPHSKQTLEDIISESEKTRWLVLNKYSFYCTIENEFGHYLIMEKESGKYNILFLKDNEPFTITGIDGKFKFEFSALKPHPYCGDIVKSDNLFEILENSTLTERQAYIVNVEEEKKQSFFDGRPGRIKIQDYRY